MRKVLFAVSFICIACTTMAQNALEQLSLEGGYSVKQYVPIGISYEKNGIIGGLQIAVPSQGMGWGPDFSETINWNSKSDPIDKEGTFWLPVTLDVAKRINSSWALGVGMGYAVRIKYRNFYDTYNNEKYHIKTYDGGKGEAKVFAIYHFRTRWEHDGRKSGWYLKGQYGLLTGPGLCVGWGF